MQTPNQAFFISPIGDDGTNVRKAADAVYKKLIQPVSDRMGLTIKRGDEIHEEGNVSTQVYKYIRDSEIVFADLSGGNPNVYYELGVRHALGLSAILIIDKDEDPVFNLRTDRIIKYDKFSPEDSLEDIIKRITSSRAESKSRNPVAEALNLRTVSFDTSPTDHFLKSKMSDISEEISETKLLTGEILEAIRDQGAFKINGEKIGSEASACYIRGGTKAFTALTHVTKQAETSIKSTRFSPSSVIRTHKEYVNAIYDRVSGKDHRKPLSHYERIVAINDAKKIDDVIDHLRFAAGTNFKLHVTAWDSEFELVIVDDSHAFVHFLDLKSETNNSVEEKTIASTLYVRNNEVVARFSEIFDRLRMRVTVKTYDCLEVPTDTEKFYEFQQSVFDFCKTLLHERASGTK